MTRHVEWAEQWGEWIIVTEGVGHRYYFDCKAEAEQYIRLTEPLGHGDPYVWRRLGDWCRNHKHNFECRPHFTRKERNAANN